MSHRAAGLNPQAGSLLPKLWGVVATLARHADILPAGPAVPPVRCPPSGVNPTKECNTTGTATNDGYPEHAFNWDVVLRIRDALNQMGVRTQLSRDNDNTVGPCVDQRAALGNTIHPDAIVSIHADGGPPSGRGFHVNYSSPPLNDSQAGPAVQLANTMRDSLVAAGLQPLP